MSSFVLESLFPITQITGVKIALYAVMPYRDAKELNIIYFFTVYTFTQVILSLFSHFFKDHTFGK